MGKRRMLLSALIATYFVSGGSLGYASNTITDNLTVTDDYIVERDQDNASVVMPTNGKHVTITATKPGGLEITAKVTGNQYNQAFVLNNTNGDNTIVLQGQPVKLKAEAGDSGEVTAIMAPGGNSQIIAYNVTDITAAGGNGAQVTAIFNDGGGKILLSNVNISASVGENGGANGIVLYSGALTANNATIKVSGSYSDLQGINICNKGSLIQFTGDKSTIEVEQQDDYNNRSIKGIGLSSGAGLVANNMTIQAKADAEWCSSGAIGIAVNDVMWSTAADADSYVTLTGTNHITAKTFAYQAIGVSAGDNGTLRIENANIAAVSKYGAATAVLSSDNAKVILEGDTVLTATMGNSKGWAIQATNGSVKINETASDKNVQISGNIYNANGDIVIKGNKTSQITGDITNAGAIDIAVGQMTGDINANSGTANIYFSDNFLGKTSVGATGNAHITLHGGAWNVTGDSKLTQLTMSSGSTLSTKQGTVSTGNLVYNTGSNYSSNLNLYVDTTAQTLNILRTKTVNGVAVNDLYEKLQQDGFKVTVTDANPNTQIGATVAKEIEKTEANSIAKLFDKVFMKDRGLYQYNPQYQGFETAGDDNWRIVLTGAKSEQSTVSKAVLQTAVANNGMIAFNSDTFIKRMGELRDRKETGVWARLYKDRYEGANFNNQTSYLQLGTDKQKEITSGTLFTGFAVSYGEGTTSFTNITGANKGSNTAVGMYSSYLAKDNHYLDVVVKYCRYENGFNITTKQGVVTGGDYKQNGYGLAVEYGKKYNLRKGWFVEPQVSYSLGRLGSSAYTTQDGVHAQIDDSTLSVLRGGFSLGRQLEEARGKQSIYARFLTVHQFAGNSRVSMQDGFGNSATIGENGNDTWYEVALGTTMNLNNTISMYLEAEKNFAATIKADWKINVGARWSF